MVNGNSALNAVAVGLSRSVMAVKFLFSNFYDQGITHGINVFCGWFLIVNSRGRVSVHLSCLGLLLMPARISDCR